MIELAKHIEVLLLENDCVIVPGLGGFIAHYQSATFRKETEEFCPPSRTIGFNPQLVLNDGLLAQSYMQTYNTDFPDATRRIEKTVAVIKEQLYQQGHVDLNNVGTLYYNMYGTYEFEPVKNGFFTPSFYGLSTFKLKPLPINDTIEPEHSGADQHIMTARKSYNLIKNAAAIAATILLFFVLSTPVSNTYVDEADCASLGTNGLFEAIRNRSVASKMIGGEITQTVTIKDHPAPPRPKAVKIEKVVSGVNAEPRPSEAPSSLQGKEVKESPKVKSEPTVSEKKYAIIVASLNTANDAQKEISRLCNSGYPDATLIESQGRYRIAVATYSNAADAYKKVNDMRKDKNFASAWVYSSK